MYLPQVKIEAPEISWDGLTKRFMNPGELEVLCKLVKSVTPKTVIEFGINEGRTAKAILRECPSIEKYVGVDVLPGYVTAQRVQLKEVPAVAGFMVSKDPRVELIVTKQGSHSLEPEDLPKADAIFIDGDHSRAGVEKDTYLARSVVRKGGIIIWHDYNFVKDKVTGKMAVDVAEVLHEYRAAGCNILHAQDTWMAFELV